VIRVRIPATSANLGPGFDCMGVALDLWNTFELRMGGEGRRVVTFGEGADRLPKDETNLVATIFLSEARQFGVPEPESFEITVHNTVPAASGLGSSSTATLAGIFFAQAWRDHLAGLDPTGFSLEESLERAVALEGHGDNVAPALMGGFVVVVPDASGVLTKQVPFVPFKAVVCVPEYDYLTVDARKALPESYTKQDAIFNIGRALLVAEAFRAGEDELLAKAMADRIHEPYRLKAIPGAASALERAREAGAVAACLSGAGPGVVAFARSSFDRIGRAMKEEFSQAGLESRYWILDASPTGSHIGRLPV
jgi:homoserine kinase